MSGLCAPNPIPAHKGEAAAFGTGRAVWHLAGEASAGIWRLHSPLWGGGGEGLGVGGRGCDDPH